MIDDDECVALGGTRTRRGNRSTRRQTAPIPLRPSQIPHDLSRDRTRAAAMRSRRLTAWTMARSFIGFNWFKIKTSGGLCRTSWWIFGFHGIRFFLQDDSRIEGPSNHHWQNNPFWATASLARFCHICDHPAFIPLYKVKGSVPQKVRVSGDGRLGGTSGLLLTINKIQH
jgi:hypothetical protein